MTPEKQEKFATNKKAKAKAIMDRQLEYLTNLLERQSKIRAQTKARGESAEKLDENPEKHPKLFNKNGRPTEGDFKAGGKGGKSGSRGGPSNEEPRSKLDYKIAFADSFMNSSTMDTHGRNVGDFCMIGLLIPSTYSKV